VGYGVTRARRVLAVVALAALVASPRQAVAADDLIGEVRVSQDPALASAAPEVSMPAGVLWTTDGRVLWERSADDQRAMASTTKIMTALVVLDSADLDDIVTVSERAARVGEAGVDLAAGQRLTVRELLEATLVRSANDAAFALAEHSAGSVERFVTRMNEKAQALGLEDTSFANPHGLDAPGHHTSARDLATLARVAMEDPRFAGMVAMPAVTVTGGAITKRYENSNKLVGSYSGATGVKTGWTNKAGYCVVASAQRNDIGLLSVVLGAGSEDDRFDQAKILLDWGFEHYAVQQLSSAEETVALVPVPDYLNRTVPAIVAETVKMPVFDLAGDVVWHVDVRESAPAPVAVGQPLGTLTVVQGDQVLAQVPILAAEDVPAPDLLDSIAIWFKRAWLSLSGGPIAQPAVRLM
jgi:D-alanyl-D-alanine carboxypeptidase (penicillin-binding protein 5/6)